MQLSACAPFLEGLMNGPSAWQPRISAPIKSSVRLSRRSARSISNTAVMFSHATVIVVGRKEVTPFSKMPRAILRTPSGSASDVSAPR